MRVRVMVTGGSGFIGRRVVTALVREGAEVVLVDRVEPRSPPAGVDVRRVDVTDLEAMIDAAADVDAVSHQAARVGLGIDFDDVTDYVRDNDAGTATLLRALWRSRFRGRLVVASSMVVYGEGAYHCRDHGAVRPGPRRPVALDAGRFDPPCPACEAPLAAGTVDEDAPLDPRNVYAATKVHTEHLAAAFGREAGVPVAALRYHNVYGPGMPRNTAYAGVASIFASVVAAGQAPQVTEDGRQRRDFVHVDDVARANVAALLRHPEETGPFNVASGDPRTVGDLAAAAVSAGGPGGPAPVVTRRWRLGDVRHVVASPDRAADRLGFKAEIGFEEGMADFLAPG